MKTFFSLYLFTLLPLFTSCADMLDKDSSLVTFADREHLNNPTDTIYSVVGILNKMQVLADRTVVLGEVRGDLVDVNSYASKDLSDVALFRADTDNRYNRPRDYYAVINNCNYYLAHADTALKNNRHEHIFMKEYAAVKAIRAWTYLQLALIYGSVPFVTEPLLDSHVDESSYPRYDLQQLCQYFITDLTPYTDVDLPGYGAIGNVDSRLVFFPVSVLLGELNLWAGNYREAALCYYHYIANRNGSLTNWPLSSIAVAWPRDNAKYEYAIDSWTDDAFHNERFLSTGELISMIPGDTIPTSTNYSSLPSLFNTCRQNDGYYSLQPSVAMQRLSASQVYCNCTTTGDVGYAPSVLTNRQGSNMAGDLRLPGVWHTYNHNVGGLSSTEGRPTAQLIDKFTRADGTPSTNTHLWRRAMVYLHMAEAINRAGLPQLAFRFLSTGVNNHVIAEMKNVYPADSAYIAQFNFPNTEYVLRTENPSAYNTIGLHSRGSGWTEYNEYYPMPDDTLLTDSQARQQHQIEGVEDLLVDECALELAFEGVRFYDLMRVAIRRGDASYLARKVYGRRADSSNSGITADLTQPRNWYLPWKEIEK